jgi:hypothetical protein
MNVTRGCWATILSVGGCIVLCSAHGAAFSPGDETVRLPDRWCVQEKWIAKDYFDDPMVIALCNAIRDRDFPAVKRLVVEGADANAIAKHGMTPLLWTIPDTDLRYFALLLESGADPNVPITSELGIPFVLTEGRDVTFLTASHLKAEFLELVLIHGGNPNSMDRIFGIPALAAAADQTESLRKVKALVDHGADVNCWTESINGRPVVSAAFLRFEFESTLYLLNSGADPRPMDFGGFSLLHRLYDLPEDPVLVDVFVEPEFDEIKRFLKKKYPTELMRAEAEMNEFDRMVAQGERHLAFAVRKAAAVRAKRKRELPKKSETP